MSSETARAWALGMMSLLGCLMSVACAGERHFSRPPTAMAAGGGTAEPASPAEAKVLEQLDAVAPGQPKAVGDLTVVADAPYHAASGKKCRQVTMTTKRSPKVSRTRLACNDGGAWQFVPNVFLAPSEQ